MNHKKLQIAQISPFYYPSIGGVEGVVQYTAEELVRRGHDVHVLTAGRNHKGGIDLHMPEFQTYNGVKIHRFKSLINIGHMSFFPKCIQLLRKNHFDVIHSHGYRHPHGELAVQIGKRKSIPIVLHGHAPFIPKASIGWRKALLYGCYDYQARIRLLKHIDHIVALTEFEKQQYLKLAVPGEKITIIPNAASDECFELLDPTPFLSRYNLQGKRILLFVGNLNSAKRPDLLIKALPKLIEKVPDVFLVLVGPDEGMLSRVQELAHQLKVENYYQWTGPLYGKEKAQAFSAAELFLLPSDLDALPLVLVEAMAYGIPVIGSDAIGPTEIIDHGETGFIIKRGSVDDIVKASLKLLTDHKLRNTLGQKAKEMAIVRYKVSKVVNTIEKIYYSLLNNKN